MTTSRNASTIRDVARLAGVSVATISRYLNNSAPLSAETAERVQAAMTELNFSPHPAARSLATNRTNTIGLVLNKIEGDYFTPLLEGVVAVTEAQNFNLLIFTSNQSRHLDARLLGPTYTDGLLIFLDSINDEGLSALHKIKQPIVLIHRSSPTGLNLPMVTIKNQAASMELVSHLIESHLRKNIVFLRGPKNNEDSYWREKGYRQALAQHGIKIDESLIASGDYDIVTAQNSVNSLITAGKKFDAVFAADDVSALGALTALKESGIDVPGKVSVVGFDDQRLAPYLNPPLTTVHAPTDQVGSAAAELLLKIVHNEQVQSETLLPTKMVLRQSCGCNG
jgi:LacI family transcriptional regulator